MGILKSLVCLVILTFWASSEGANVVEILSDKNVVLENDSLNFTCQTIGNSLYNFTLYKDGNIFEASSENITANYVEFVIENITQSDIGTYSCEVSSRNGSYSSRNITITLGAIPLVTLSPQSKNVSEFQQLVLQCNGSGNPSPSFTWFKDDVEIDNLTYSITSSMDGSSILNGTASGNSAGNYYCELWNQFSRVNSSSASVIIYTLPYFTFKPLNKTIKIGDSVSFECNASSIPLPNINWYRNGNLLNSSSYNVTSGLGYSLLTINNVENGHNGSYRCEAYNSFDSALRKDANTSLIVLAPPGQIPEIKIIASSKSFDIAWAPPLFLGNLFVSNYTIKISQLTNQNYTSPNCNGSLQSGECIVNKTMATIMDLHPALKYYVRIVASNAVGSSIPKESSAYTDEAAPGKIAIISAMVLSATGINISWGQPLPLNGIVRYRLQRTLANESNWQLIFDGNETREFNDMGLHPYTVYSYRVMAYNLKYGLNGSESESINETTKQSAPSAPPQEVKVSTTNSTSLNVVWRSPPDGNKNGIITEYLIQYKSVSEVSYKNVSVEGNIFSVDLVSLQIFTNYTITVAARTQVGLGPNSPSITRRTDEDVPSIVMNVSVTVINSTSINITWGAPLKLNGYVGYKLERTLANESQWELIFDSTTRGFTDTGLHPYTVYSYRVLAYNLKYNLNSSESQEVNGTTQQSVPSASPQKVQVTTINSTSLKVTWKSPPDGNKNGIVIIYLVRYKSVSELSYKNASMNGTILSVDLANLEIFTNYTISVAAGTSIGLGPYSPQITGLTDEDVPLDPPRNILVVDYNATALRILWSPPVRSYGRIAYLVYQIGSVANTADLLIYNGSLTEAYARNLEEFRNYTFFVKAYNIKYNLEGPSSIHAVGETRQEKPSESPQSVIVRAFNSTSLNITWSPPPILHQNGHITQYRLIYFKANNSEVYSTIVVNGNKRNIILVGLDKFTAYNVTISAATAVGFGPYSSLVSVKTDEDAPESPANDFNAFTINSTAIFLNWTVPIVPNGIVEYSIYQQLDYLNSPQEIVYQGPDTSYVARNLHAYFNYTYRIVVYNKKYNLEGPSTKSIKRQTDQDAPSAPPRNVTGFGNSSTTIYLNWDPPSIFDENGIILLYSIRYMNIQTNVTVQKEVVGTRNYALLENLKKWSEYRIAISCSTVIGRGPFSAILSVMTDEDVPASPVRDLNITAVNSTTLMVSWLPPTIPNGRVKFLVYSNAVDTIGSILACNVEQLHCSIVGLQEYTDYNITVVVYNFKYDLLGPPSESVVGRTLQDVPSAPPMNVSITVLSDTSLGIRWNAPLQKDQNGIITSYQIRYNISSLNPIKESYFTNYTLSGLSIFTVYGIEVRANTVVGSGPWSEIIYNRTDEAIPAFSPNITSISNIQNTTVTLHWPALALSERHGIIIGFHIILNNTDFEIFQNVTISAADASVSVGERSYVITNLKPFSTYDIALQVFNKKGPAAIGFTKSVKTTEGVPTGPPINVNADLVARSTSLNITWQLPVADDRNGIIDRFIIYYEPFATSSTIQQAAVAGNITNYLLQGLQIWTNYSISICAVTIAVGPCSINVYTQTDESVPKNPQDLTATTVSTTQIRLSWRAPLEPNGIIKYNVYGSQVSQPPYIIGSTESLFFFVRGLKPYHYYSFFVKALNKKYSLLSNQSNLATNRTLQAAPGPLRNVTAIPLSSTSININWLPPLPEELNGIISRYNVEYKLVGRNESKVETTLNNATTSLIISGLRKFSEYRIVAYAINDFLVRDGNGTTSAPITVVTKEDAPSQGPVPSIIVITDRRITITWNKLAVQYRNGIVRGYVISYYDPWNMINKNVNLTSNDLSLNESSFVFVVKALHPFTNYSFGIAAYTSVGVGPANVQAHATTNQSAPDAAPRGVQGTNTSATSILIMWSPPVAISINGIITKYVVKVNNFTRETTLNQIEVAQLSVFTKYAVQVAAYTVDIGPFSSLIYIYTDELTPGSVAVLNATIIPPQIPVTDRSPVGLQVNWFAPAMPNGIIIDYVLEYFPTRNASLIRTVTVDCCFYSINDLVAFQYYNVSLTPSTSKGYGSTAMIMIRTDSTVPSEVRSLEVARTTSTEIDIEWQSPLRPNGLVNYTISYRTSRASLDTVIYTNDTYAKLENLEKYTFYHISVQSYNREKLLPSSKSPMNITIRTQIAAPDDSPQNVTVMAINQTKIFVSWKPPAKPNGVIARYVIRQTNTANEIIGVDTYVSNRTNETLINLSPNTLYGISVRAATSRGNGPFSQPVFIKTNRYVISPGSSPTVNQTGSDNVVINIQPPNQAAGTNNALYYQVIVVRVAKNTELDLSPIQLSERIRPFNDSRQPDLNVPYITCQFLASDYSKRKAFVIGSRSEICSGNVTSSQSRRKRATSCDNYDYKNPSLSPSSYYLFFTRAILDCTDPTQITYSFSQISVTIETAFNPSITIAIAIVVSIIILGIATGGFIYWRKYYQPLHKDSKSNNSLLLTQLTDSHVNNHMQDITERSGKPISASEFSLHVSNLHKDGDIGFSQQYSTIQQINNKHESNCGRHPFNIKKNRYANITCYDHSRVRLAPVDGEEGSDYIHANYIDGFGETAAYIATQGPTKATVADFWRLVWEKEISTIVMLTNVVENRREKCLQYWPTENEERFKSITVKIVESFNLADYTVRRFELCKEGNEKSHETTQFHYTSWPDHGVPKHSTSILSFVRKSSIFHSNNKTGPMLVHCSAGVGRTGTYITLDAMLKRLRKDKTVDVMGFVVNMRKNRNYMVQTETQYIFIHDALVEAVRCGNTSVAAHNFSEYYRNLKMQQPNGDKTLLEAEYSNLRNISYDRKICEGKKSYNVNKNRDKSIFPDDEYRVRLSMVPGIDGSDYINAGYVDGYRRTKAYIVTQIPLDSTIGDFWRMIWEQQCRVIVALTTESDHELYAKYLPSVKKKKIFEEISVEALKQRKNESYVSTDLKLFHKQESASKIVRHLHYLNWKNEALSQHSQDIVDLIDQAEKIQPPNRNKAMTVISRTGTGPAGMFITLAISLDKLKTEKEVDIFQIVNKLRSQRPGIMQTQDQYTFCYETLVEYMK